MKSWLVALGVLVAACSHPAPHADVAAAPERGARTLTIIGTNDLHGALDRLPLLAGFIDNVRAARTADGGGVLVLSAGDLFQGTLESNIAEGADVVRALNAIGYAASAVGNHEFDFGPEGPAVTARSIEDDPRGALKARVHEAKFPFLVSNILDAKSGHRIQWPNMPASTIVEVAGTKVGLIGASTASTPYTTMPANFVGLKMAPVAAAITREAKALRANGAEVVVVVGHLGSECKDNTRASDLSSCNRNEELFSVLDALPPGLVDVFVAGHTHAAIAHRIDGVAVIESYSSGRAFGRVDLRLTGTHVSAVKIYPPDVMCPLDKAGNPAPLAQCHPAPYEGRPVAPDPAVQKIVDDALARTAKQRDEHLGVTLSAPVTKAYSSESAEGDLFTDLMLAAEPGAEVALTNGGGLRADLPAGMLTYGALFRAMPFDNRFALVKLHGKQLRRLVTNNLLHGHGIFSWGGLTAKARCKHGMLDVQIAVRGKPLANEATYTVVTSDFLASGGDGVIGRLELPPGSIQVTDVIIRDAMADVLRKRKGKIDPATLVGPGHRRLDYPGQRPVECAPPPAPPAPEPD